MHRLYTASSEPAHHCPKDLAVMVGAQPFEQLGLAQAGRVRGAEQLQQFALQQAEQLFQRQLTLGIDPALLSMQWRCRQRAKADRSP